MRQTMSELTKRIIVAIIGIPVLFTVTYLGVIPFTIAIAIVSSLALYEFYNIAEKKGYPTFKVFGILLGLIPFVSILAVHIFEDFYGGMATLSFMFGLIISFIPLVVTVTLLLVLFSKQQNAIASIGTMFTGIFYISCSLSALVLIRYSTLNWQETTGYENSGFFVIVMFCSIWICDTAAYFIGRKFGKHKLMERVSPKKSVEGAIAGFIAATVFFPIALYFLLPKFNIIYSLILGLTVGIFGQIGDLIESKIKRDADVKDSSNLIPGHGGVLDRFDSIIFVSPIIFTIIVISEIFFKGL